MMKGGGEIFMKETVGIITKTIVQTITKNIMKTMVITADRDTWDTLTKTTGNP